MTTKYREYETEDELIGRLYQRIPISWRAEVEPPLRLATKMHACQTRPNGESQNSHILRVAILAANFALEERPRDLTNIVAAALCHDLLEDTPVSDEELVVVVGQQVARIVRAVSHEREDEADEVYLARVAAGGELAVLTKRFDRLDNLATLAGTAPDFRAQKLAEIRASLPLWEAIDPEGAAQIAALLELVPG